MPLFDRFLTRFQPFLDPSKPGNARLSPPVYARIWTHLLSEGQKCAPRVRMCAPLGQMCAPLGQMCAPWLEMVRNGQKCQKWSKPLLKTALKTRFLWSQPGYAKTVSDVTMSRCHDVKMSRCQDVTMSRCQDVRKSRFCQKSKSTDKTPRVTECFWHNDP